MAERLNNVAYNEISGSSHSSSGFNPRYVSLDIRTPEELAAVNGFLLALGRDVSGIARYPTAPSHPTNLSTENYFDPATLSQLGLTGMPGISSGNFGFSDAPYVQSSNRNSYNSRSNQSAFPGQIFNDIPDPTLRSYPISDFGRRLSKYPTGSTFLNQHHHQHPTPPSEINSPQSSVSTPATNTPPQLPLDSFDYLRPSRGTSVAHLAPPEYMNKAVRQMIPLKSLPTDERPPQPIEPKLPVTLHRPLASTNSADTAPLKSGSLYPLLTSGDVQYRLPPLKKTSSSSGGRSQYSSPDNSMNSSPGMKSTVLPSIHSITSDASDFDDQQHLSSQIGRIESNRASTLEQRKMHADFILNLLVSVNQNFMSRHSSTRDVEMTPA